jgi:hypothetical protein
MLQMLEITTEICNLAEAPKELNFFFSMKIQCFVNFGLQYVRAKLWRMSTTAGWTKIF